ncbi:MAG: SH3 domain-containing protein [Chloroflexota bacterium]|nr:SH3 domain-containing protein [Chloroflexota bacterium]
MRKSSFSPRQGPSVWSILGWLFLVALGIGLVWIGFVRSPGRENGQAITGTESPGSATPAPTQTPALYPTFTPLPTVATPTPLPIDSPVATPIPPTPTEIPVTPVATVGESGVNVRSGPGTNYTKLGYLEPSAQANVTGRYNDWWQIQYDGGTAWVFGELVTASDVDGVAQVEPPPAPTAAPVTAIPPTAVAPTAAPQPTAAPVTDIRGLHPDKFEVEGAPGPYNVGQAIWFHIWITNKTASSVEYEYLGVQVEETGRVQKSYTYSEFTPNQQFHHHDQMHDKIDAPGTYHLWLVIQFRDGNGFKLLGPVEVIVQ